VYAIDKCLSFVNADYEILVSDGCKKVKKRQCTKNFFLFPDETISKIDENGIINVGKFRRKGKTDLFMTIRGYIKKSPPRRPGKGKKLNHSLIY